MHKAMQTIIDDFGDRQYCRYVWQKIERIVETEDVVYGRWKDKLVITWSLDCTEWYICRGIAGSRADVFLDRLEHCREEVP